MDYHYLLLLEKAGDRDMKKYSSHREMKHELSLLLHGLLYLFIIASFKDVSYTSFEYYLLDCMCQKSSLEETLTVIFQSWPLSSVQRVKRICYPQGP